MRIRQKLFISHVSVVIITATLLSCMFFAGARGTMKREELAKLEVIAELKARVIESIFRELKKDITTAQSFYNIKLNLPILISLKNDKANPSYLKAHGLLQNQLKEMLKNKGLANIIFLDTGGSFIAAVDEDRFRLEHENSTVFFPRDLFSSQKDEVWVSDMYIDSGKIGMLIAAQAYDMENNNTGFIILEVDMSSIYAAIQDTTGLGESGETLIGKITDDGAVYLNRLRYDKEAPLNRRISFSGAVGIPMLEAVRGRNGMGESTDYRGKMVVAAWRFIPSLGWGLVAKIDAVEAFEPVRRIKDYVIILTVIAILLAVAYSLMVARGISGPIRKLHKGSEMIGAGNLNYSVATDTKDEIGQLSRAFNRMASDLKKITASRDELNREISERKKAEEALIMVQKAVDSSSDAIGISDPHGRHFYQNRAFTDMLGYSAEELNKPLGSIITFEDADTAREVFNAIIHGGSWRGEIVMVAKSGQKISVSLRADAIRDADGRIIGLISIHTDITERKKIQNELSQKMQDLERFSNLVVGRELKMEELEKKIDGLQKRLDER